MSFATHGFLSPGMADFRSRLREISQCKVWFTFAESLSSLSLSALQGHEINRDDNRKLLTTVLFVRALKSFQAILSLVENGLLGDARGLVRRASEGAIALNALASDSGFAEQITNAHRFYQRKIARLSLAEPNYRSAYTPEQIAEMEKTIKDVDAEEAAGVTIRDIIWANVAAKHCKDLYELVYRLFSSDGIHTTLDAIHREMIFHEGQLVGVKVGPHSCDR